METKENYETKLEALCDEIKNIVMNNYIVGDKLTIEDKDILIIIKKKTEPKLKELDNGKI